VDRDGAGMGRFVGETSFCGFILSDGCSLIRYMYSRSLLNPLVDELLIRLRVICTYLVP